MLGVDAELLGAAAHPHAGPLTWKSGFTRTATRGRMPRLVADGDEPLASVSDSISTVTPAATAWVSSSGACPARRS